MAGRRRRSPALPLVVYPCCSQRKKCNHFVLPIFYHVDPSNVRNQRRIEVSVWTSVANLTTGLSNCLACLGIEAKQGSKWTKGNVRRWKAALTEIANLTGMELSGSMPETNFIAEVVEKVRCKLDLKQLSTPPNLIGMDVRVEVINSWLKKEHSNAMAICGMGGSGKTTLARCIYNLNKQYFESSSFVEEIGDHYKHDVLGLQKQLLRDVLKGKEIMISSVSEGTHKIEEVLQKKKVLIVLDDIDDQDELSTLLGTKSCLTHSKIIVTTRLLDIHSWFESISWRCWVHELKLLNDLESLELLSLCAFRSKTPMKVSRSLLYNYHDIVEEIHRLSKY
ncbi:hypothetical protein L1987_64733 [Smallanthus sonchifolius]|uniref:Uncharacterized protein n=1 Tax=Smallanthus sonchifolius TaxID=185202 RepID=A0ACB9BSK3_9ASTR|nr:hypothetical protein L1987_64733 [Smallanthus sonchifolius]